MAWLCGLVGFFLIVLPWLGSARSPGGLAGSPPYTSLSGTGVGGLRPPDFGAASGRVSPAASVSSAGSRLSQASARSLDGMNADALVKAGVPTTCSRALAVMGVRPDNIAAMGATAAASW